MAIHLEITGFANINVFVVAGLKGLGVTTKLRILKQVIRSNSVQYSESDICSLSIQIFITNHDYPILVNSAAFWPKTSYCHTAGGLICGGLRGLPPTSVNI